MSIESRILVENTSAEATDSTFVYSDKNKGAGFHRVNNGVHTYVYQTDDFVGTIKLQATLEMYPGDEDWFDIDNTTVGLLGDSTEFQGDTVTGNFTGQFLWIRAAYNLQNGTITQIRYNF